MGSKKTTENQATHSVTTPTNPEWVTSGIQGLAGQIAGLGSLDPASLVAGANPLQTQAAGGAAGLTGLPDQWNTALGTATGLASMAAPQMQSQSLLTNLQDYMSPYIGQVVNSALGDFDVNAGHTLGQQTLDMAGAGAFGGSGSALTRSMTADSLSRGRAGLDAGLRDQAFNTGAALSGQDADRRQSASAENAGLTSQNNAQRLSAASLIGNLTGAQDANSRANVGLQGTLGDMLRQIQQQQLGAPVSLLSAQTGLMDSLPLSLFHGESTDATGTKTTKTSDPMGSLGTLAMGLGALGLAPFTGGASMAGLLASLTAGGAAAGSMGSMAGLY